MRTAVAKVADLVFEIRELVVPEAVATKILKMSRKPLYVAFDLSFLKAPPAEVTEWADRFIVVYRRLALETGVDDLPPAIAVFVNNISTKDKRALRGLEITVFDTSLISNADCKTPSQFRDHLRSAVQKSRDLANTKQKRVARRKMSSEEFRALNSFPEGVTPDDIDRLVEELNRRSAADPDRAEREARSSGETVGTRKRERAVAAG
jgi:hypothetical protein